MSEKEARASRGDRAMQEWICHENIKSLRAQFAAAHDETQRTMLSTLIAEQEASLKQLRSTPQA
jgi:hypothetical protein